MGASATDMRTSIEAVARWVLNGKGLSEPGVAVMVEWGRVKAVDENECGACTCDEGLF